MYTLKEQGLGGLKETGQSLWNWFTGHVTVSPGGVQVKTTPAQQNVPPQPPPVIVQERITSTGTEGITKMLPLLIGAGVLMMLMRR
jgi:hypothetical protein